MSSQETVLLLTGGCPLPSDYPFATYSTLFLMTLPQNITTPHPFPRMLEMLLAVPSRVHFKSL